MPYAIIPVEGGFKVVNTSSGKVHAAHTTRDKAEAQVRLLRGVEHGMTVRGRRGSTSSSSSEERDEAKRSPPPFKSRKQRK